MSTLFKKLFCYINDFSIIKCRVQIKRPQRNCWMFVLDNLWVTLENVMNNCCILGNSWKQIDNGIYVTHRIYMRSQIMLDMK